MRLVKLQENFSGKEVFEIDGDGFTVLGFSGVDFDELANELDADVEEVQGYGTRQFTMDNVDVAPADDNNFFDDGELYGDEDESEIDAKLAKCSIVAVGDTKSDVMSVLKLA